MSKEISYTKSELDSLSAYGGRGRRERKNTSLSEYLGLINNNEINNFLLYLTNKNITVQPVEIEGLTLDDYRIMLRDIDNLFSVACKYGFTHELPESIKRGDPYAGRMLSNGTNNWLSDKMLSCSTGDVSQFSYTTGRNGRITDSTIITFSFSEKDRRERKIPFIKINDILKEGDVFNGEKEIILPPFFETRITDKREKVPAPNGHDFFRYFYSVDFSSRMNKPEKEIETLSDEELQSCIDAINAVTPKTITKDFETSEEKKNLEHAKSILRNYIQTRFHQIYNQTLFEVLDREELSDYFYREELSKLNSKHFELCDNARLARYMADDRVFELELDNYYRNIFPNISHAERINRELGFVCRNPNYFKISDAEFRDRDNLELKVHGRVEDRENRMGLKVNEFRVMEQTIAEISKANIPENFPTDYYTRTLETIEKRNLNIFRSRQKKEAMEQTNDTEIGMRL